MIIYDLLFNAIIITAPQRIRRLRRFQPRLFSAPEIFIPDVFYGTINRRRNPAPVNGVDFWSVCHRYKVCTLSQLWVGSGCMQPARLRVHYVNVKAKSLCRTDCHLFRLTESLASAFYRAMHYSAKRGLAIACRLSSLSVCPSVCLWRIMYTCIIDFFLGGGGSSCTPDLVATCLDMPKIH